MSERKVLKATIWYTVSNFILKGIGLFTTPIFTRILTKVEYGTYTNFVTWYSVISIIATLSLVSSLVRARFDFRDTLNSFVKSNLLMGSSVTLIVSSVIWLNREFFSGLFVLEEKYILIMCISIFVSPAYDMFLCIQRFQYKYKLVAILSMFISISSILISLLFIYMIEDNLLARVIGSYLPSFFVSLVLYIYFIFRSGTIQWKYCKYALPIAIPYIFHLLSGTILNSSDKAVITRMTGAAENALYSLAYSVGLMVNVVWNAMNSAFIPWLGDQLNEKKYESIKRYSYGYVLIFVVGVIGLMLLAPEILVILGGVSYYEARYCVPPVMGGYYFLFVYSMYVNIEQYEKKTIPMAIATCIVAFINVVSNVFFVDLYGYIAAAYTTLGGYILLFLFHYGLVRKMKLHIVYDTKFFVVMSILICIFMVGSLFLYDYNIIRYGIIGLYVVFISIIAWKKKNIILKILGK